jgi:hypothetical protein
LLVIRRVLKPMMKLSPLLLLCLAGGLPGAGTFSAPAATGTIQDAAGVKPYLGFR